MIALINESSTTRLPVSFIRVKKWLQLVASTEGYTIGDLIYKVMSDDAVLQVNRNFLDHDFYTDIITFDYTSDKHLSADIVVSIDRIVDNAHMTGNSIKDEYLRVMVHGVLHLMGYKDKSEPDEVLMRQKENDAIRMFHVKHF